MPVEAIDAAAAAAAAALGEEEGPPSSCLPGEDIIWMSMCFEMGLTVTVPCWEGLGAMGIGLVGDDRGDLPGEKSCRRAFDPGETNRSWPSSDERGDSLAPVRVRRRGWMGWECGVARGAAMAVGSWTSW